MNNYGPTYMPSQCTGVSCGHELVRCFGGALATGQNLPPATSPHSTNTSFSGEDALQLWFNYGFLFNP